MSKKRKNNEGETPLVTTVQKPFDQLLMARLSKSPSSGKLVTLNTAAAQQRKTMRFAEACYEAGQIAIREHFRLPIPRVCRKKGDTRKFLVPDPKLVAVPEAQRATVARWIAISLLAGAPARKMFEPWPLFTNTKRDENAVKRFLKLYGPGNDLIDDNIVQLRKEAEDLVRKYENQIASLGALIILKRSIYHGISRSEIMDALGSEFQQRR